MDNTKIYNVKNRSVSVVVYKLPEDGIRREFMPGETKKIPYTELEKLTYQSGGRELMANYLQILDEEVLSDLGIATEPEYYMSELDIVKLIKEDSLDAFLDFLDFAPVGNIDLLKKLSISIPLTDYQKRQALKEKTGFDVDTAIKNLEAEKAEEAENKNKEAAPQRRKVVEEKAPVGRRTSASKYKVVNTNK